VQVQDHSRYIVSWKLCTNMRAEDVTDTLDLDLQAPGCDQVHVAHKPRLLSDNGSSYVSGNLAEWLKGQGMKHSRGAPYHPQTQGKIERWHQTLKNRILLENYFLPDDLEAQVEAFVDHYNHQRYHESLNTSHRLTSTSDGTKTFYNNEKGSNGRHSKRGACITDSTPHNQTNQMSQTLS
jgi:transposase InsO family protein